MANQSKSLSPNSNGLANNLDGSPNQLQQGQANGSLSSSPEKPLHYTYLKGFRVEQCALFLQHKCTNHKPFTCFDWHFQNQRRRRPVRRRDGTFNYSPDTYCTKYDETTGICPDKDDCPFLHKTAGDTERRYHLRYYKTGICIYETDARGYCTKNGKHCAFAHGAQDLRNPVFDVRELQTLENGNSSGELSDSAGLISGTSGAASTDRERNALLEEPRWNETAFVLANYKTVLCKRPPRFCRQGYACPQYHNGKDRRRSPKIFKYRSTPCPNTKQGDEWVDPSKCEQGDQCPYCHSRTEQQFHPEIFKSTKCKDMQDSGYCPRGAFCAFAHNEEEIIATRDIDLDNIDVDSSRSTLSQSYPGESQIIRHHQVSEDLRATLENRLSTLERMRPFNNLEDDDDIFSSNNNNSNNSSTSGNNIRRMSDRNDNIIIGAQENSDADSIVNNLLGIESVIRPRSTSTSANSSLFSTTGLDLRGGSILQQQSAAAAAAAAVAASYINSRPNLSNSLDINISNSNQSELNLSNHLSARASNDTLVNSLANTYNMDLASNMAHSNNAARLGVSFADQTNSALPSSSLSTSTASPTPVNNNNLGPIARPRSYSHSQSRSNTDFNQLHAALARARLIDELKNQSYGVSNSSNSIGFRERAVQSFSISSAKGAESSLFNANNNPVSALDFLPSSRLSNLNLGSKEMDMGQLVINQNNPMANQSKSLSPNSNGLANNLDGSPIQLQQGQANGSLSSSPEKPLHYTYLKGFRVEQCALFLQHKCTNHKPFTCFDWHFQNQRRRRPVRRRDGTFNYSPDTYCTKYDETTGICPDKDDCPFLHKTAGDTERRYHLRYYKTGICIYETDARGYCTKNGKHCAFAHGAQDLRNPVFDVRELQTLENGNSSGELSDSAGLISGTSGAASTDRERNALLEEPRWNETAFVLANYKTVLCKRPPRFCRQGYACPQYHNGKDRRRSPKIFKYRSTPCPNTKQGDEWVDPSKCEQGDQCPYCHSRTEQQFHPEIFKSTKCKDMQDSGYCPRGAFCAFAHNEEEIIATRDIDLDNIDVDSSRSTLSQSYPGESQIIRHHQVSEDLRATLENRLSTLERMRPFNNLEDDDDIFSSNNNNSNNSSTSGNNIRRMSDRNDNIIIGAQENSDADSIVNNLLGIESVIRPRSTSTSANSSLFSTTGLDLRGGSILQQQSAAAAAAAAVAASYINSRPNLSNSLDINISNSNQSELNLSNHLSARASNDTLVNSLANTYNMDLASNMAHSNNAARLGVSFADQTNSALPSSSISTSNALPSSTKNNLK